MKQEKIVKNVEERLITSAKNNAKKIQEFYLSKYELGIKNYREVVQNEANLYIEKELEELKQENALLTAQGHMQLREKLFSYRENKVDELFQNVRQDLDQFVASKDYASYLNDSLKEALGELKEFEGSILVRKEDEKILKTTLKVQTTNQIKIGGFILVDTRGNEIDYTLDDRLNSEKSYFQQSSNLIL